MANGDVAYQPVEAAPKSNARRNIAAGIAFALAGGFVTLVGLFLYKTRLEAAVAFLDARTMLGMPFDQTDSNKVAVMGLVGMGMMGFGGLVAGVGILISLIAFAKSE